MVKILPKSKRPTEFYFFSGKGGVGKTSMACATALRFSKKSKVLLISTDPAHSISDSFETKIGGKIKGIKKNLFAVEIDPQVSLEEYKEKLLPMLPNPDFFKSLGLDMMDMASTPGVDEIAAFDKFLQFMNSRDYDIIIFDTAPMGHTLRLLSFPDVLESYIGKIIMLKARFENITNLVKRFLPFGEEEKQKINTKDAIEEIKKKIQEAKKLLASKQTNYNMVMIPEEMSIIESERAIKIIKDYNIRLGSIIVNRIIPENPGCTFCSAKRKQQIERLKDIKKRFKDMDILQVPLFKDEVKGFKMLERLGSELYHS